MKVDEAEVEDPGVAATVVLRELADTVVPVTRTESTAATAVVTTAIDLVAVVGATMKADTAVQISLLAVDMTIEMATVPETEVIETEGIEIGRDLGKKEIDEIEIVGRSEKAVARERGIETGERCLVVVIEATAETETARPNQMMLTRAPT